MVGCYVDDGTVNDGQNLEHKCSSPNRQDGHVLTPAAKMMMLSLLQFRRVPRRAMSVRDIRHIITHAVTTTIGP